MSKLMRYKVIKEFPGVTLKVGDTVPEKTALAPAEWPEFFKPVYEEGVIVNVYQIPFYKVYVACLHCSEINPIKTQGYCLDFPYMCMSCGHTFNINLKKYIENPKNEVKDEAVKI
jgi:hypothetical protein